MWQGALAALASVGLLAALAATSYVVAAIRHAPASLVLAVILSSSAAHGHNQYETARGSGTSSRYAPAHDWDADSGAVAALGAPDRTPALVDNYYHSRAIPARCRRSENRINPVIERAAARS
jgi:hypothetical protein